MLAPPPGEAYRFIIDLTGYPSWIFYGSSVVGLLVLRYKSPDLHRPFRSFFVMNIIFIFACVMLAVLPFVPPLEQKPDELPFWLYPTIAVTFIIISGGLWKVMVHRRAGREVETANVVEGEDEVNEVSGGMGGVGWKG